MKTSPGDTVVKNDIRLLRRGKHLGARHAGPLPCGCHSDNVLSLAATSVPPDTRLLCLERK